MDPLHARDQLVMSPYPMHAGMEWFPAKPLSAKLYKGVWFCKLKEEYVKDSIGKPRSAPWILHADASKRGHDDCKDFKLLNAMNVVEKLGQTMFRHRKAASGDMKPIERSGRRRMAMWFGIALTFLSMMIATTGREWSLAFHPDEFAIQRWMNLVSDGGYISSRAYPSGWFELFRIQLSIAKQAEKLSQQWHRHVLQDGKIVAVRTSSFSHPTVADVPEKRSPTIQDGRNFNTWLYVLTVVFLYAACLEAGFHPLAAFVSGVFFVASGAPVEFSHYCETDTALLVSMAFFAWLAARTLRKRQSWLVVVAAFAGGFAISCKFTLFPLILWCFAGPVAVLVPRTAGSRTRCASQLLALILLAVLATCAGYAAGTPALRIAPAWYMQALRGTSRATYSEITINLGGEYSWWGATVLRCRSFARMMAEIGAMPLLWGVFSWTFWFFRPHRRQLAGLPFLLPVFVPFLIFGCPFVRRQETLPFAIILAMGAGLPLQWLLFERGTRPRLNRACRLAAVLASFLAVAALWTQGSRALGMASCFAMRDTRAEAQNWLRDSLPSGEMLLLDHYVEQITRGVQCHPFFHSGLPFIWDGNLPEKNGVPAHYYVENIGFAGRKPIRDTKTGNLFPHVRRSIEAYNADVLPLREWALAPWTPVPTFGQPRVRLVALERMDSGAFDVPLGYDRPIRVLDDGFRLYDAGGISGLGPQRAIHTVGKRTTVHVNLANGKRWLVTRMLEGSDGVRVVREGLFAPEKAELPPGGVAVAELAAGPLERIAARTSGYSSTRCRMRGDDQNNFCASFLASTPSEAARALRLSGNPEGALALLRDCGDLDASAQIEAFLAATDKGVPPDGTWIDTARGALEAVDRLAHHQDTLGRTNATLCGVPLGVACDFARMRTGVRMLVPGVRLPVWLPAGRYDVSLAFHRMPETPIPARFFKGQSSDCSVSTEEDGDVVLHATLDLPKGQMLRLLDELDTGNTPFKPFAADVEIAWSPVGHTLAAAEVLRERLGRQSVAVPGDNS